MVPIKFLRNLVAAGFLLSISINLWVVSAVNLGRRSRLCDDYPDTVPAFRFHRESRNCYQVGENGPCPELMKFTAEDDTFGYCDCDLKQRCGRPLIYWPARQRCYYAYDQGPCRPGKILQFGYNLTPVCRKNICESFEDAQPSSGSRYWFSYNNTCYRTFTQGYCPQSDDILFNVDHHYRPTCQKSMSCGEVNPPQIAKCVPGQRVDVLGFCKRRFVALRNTTKPLDIKPTRKPANIYCLFCDEANRVKYKV